MIKTAAPPAPPRSELDIIEGDFEADVQIEKLTEYLSRAKARTARAMALRDAAIRSLAASGWSHRRVAEHAKVSVSTVRAILR